MAANRELLEYSKMQPGPAGLMQLNLKEEIYTAHTALDIENLIKASYLATPYPQGVQMDPALPPEGQKQSFWSWGYIKKSPQHKTYKEAIADNNNSKMFMSEKYQQLGTAKFFEGALLDARFAFEIHHNNYDIILFVKFTDMEIKGL